MEITGGVQASELVVGLGGRCGRHSPVLEPLGQSVGFSSPALCVFVCEGGSG